VLAIVGWNFRFVNNLLVLRMKLNS
jgi:hypothetical protein